MVVIHSLKIIVFILTGELADIQCLNNSFSSIMFISEKCWFQLCVLSKYYNHFYRILAAIHYFNGTVQFSDVKIFSHPNLPTHFLSVYVKTPVPVKQTSYRSSYIFRVASIILKWAVTWSCYFFTEIFFSEHLVV